MAPGAGLGPAAYCLGGTFRFWPQRKSLDAAWHRPMPLVVGSRPGWTDPCARRWLSLDTASGGMAWTPQTAPVATGTRSPGGAVADDQQCPRPGAATIRTLQRHLIRRGNVRSCLPRPAPGRVARGPSFVHPAPNRDIAWILTAMQGLGDSYDPMLPHLAAHDVTLICALPAPVDKLQACKRRMGWTFPTSPGSAATTATTSALRSTRSSSVRSPPPSSSQFEGRRGHRRDGRLVRH